MYIFIFYIFFLNACMHNKHTQHILCKNIILDVINHLTARTLIADHADLTS